MYSVYLYHVNMLQINIIKCSKCEYTIKSDSKFCIYCGTPIDELSPKSELKTKKTMD
jgi:hypothetical protein